MFKEASRLKLRFDSSKGQLSIEDLWDLPLVSSAGKVNLDDIARDLHSKLNNDNDVSFVIKEKKSDVIIQLKFDIVKHIIEVRLVEDAARTLARNNSEKKQYILRLIADKQDEELKGKSLDDLKAMMDELN